MIVNIEFLDHEPIENMMTGLHFQIDKTIFFGFEKEIAEKRKVTERFLKKYCQVKDVAFYSLSERKLESVLRTMQKVIDHEREQGNEIFFDITGGEELILLAFGMLAERLHAPIHRFHVAKQKLIELNRETAPPISQRAKRRKVELTLDGYIEMYGGVINYRMQKNIKSVDDQEFVNDIKKLWEVSQRYGQTWNLFADFLRRCCIPDENMYVDVTDKEVVDAIRKIGKFHSADEPEELLASCAEIGVLRQFSYTKERLSFFYKTERIQELLWDAGSILEMHTFFEERITADDCKVGVHLDWDGIIYNESGKDTLNEIDVLSLRGVIPTFISCKNGSVNQIALYELQTVAERFGGAYAKKVIVAPQGLNESHSLRAKEMGIEIRT